MGWEMVILVDHTPKDHCKPIGVGIEHTWGCSENHCQSMKVHNKKVKEKIVMH
jgi:hypothetical protein